MTREYFAHFNAHVRSASALALGLFVSACEPLHDASPASGLSGSLALALSSTIGGQEYRFVGTINVIGGDGQIAASVDATEQSAATHTVPLLPGEYQVTVPDGYSCRYAGTEPGFAGCTFIGATPRPFTVSSSETAFVLIEVAFHFELSEDVTVLFQTGSAELALNARDVREVRCGDGTGCVEGDVCASVDGAAPRCYARCAADEDCLGPGECLLVHTQPERSADSSLVGVCDTRAASGEDVTAPVLTSASLTPAAIDTTEGDASVEVRLDVSDDLSGIQYAQVRFSSASGQFRTCYAYPESTGVTSASLSCNAVFPAFGEGGEWPVAVHLVDAVGNGRFPSAEELLAAGLPAAVTVLANPDTTAPVLTSASLTPAAIDTTEGDASVEVRLDVSDDLSGIQYAQVRFSSASGQFRTCYAYPESTGMTSASLSCSTVFPAFGEGGPWSVAVHLVDAVGNGRFPSAEELLAAGLPATVTVLANPDTTAPVLTAASLSPAAIDTTEGDASVEVRLDVSDDLSGIQYAQVRFSSASGQFRTCYAYPESTGVTSASLSCNAVFPAFGEGGAWSVAVHLVDAVGNGRFPSAEELLTAGLPRAVQVN